MRVPTQGSILVGLLLVVVPELASAQSTAQSLESQPTVMTVGEAVVRRAADRAFITVTTETRARDPRDAQSQNAKAMSAVQEKLREANVPRDAVRTTGYGVEPEYDYTNGRRVLRDFRAFNTIEVRVDDVSRVGELIDVATTAGATSVGDVRFDLKDREAAERQALTEAVADARSRAEAAAAGARMSLGGILRIVEERTNVPSPMPMMTRAVAESAQTPIVPGEIEIRARVTLTGVLK
jgi:uncharacterized protein YggE